MIRIPPTHGGWLEVVCGPMFSGKSEEMIRRLRRAEIAGQRVVIFKPRFDDRYDAADIVSHAGLRMRAVPVDGLTEIVQRSAGHDVVGIDEVQAVCQRCSGPATTTQRLVNGHPAPYGGETVVVGAAEQYEARCRDCHEPGTDAATIAA